MSTARDSALEFGSAVFTRRKQDRTYEEGDEDGGVHKDQSEDGSPAVAEAVGYRTSKEDTDKSTALAALEESRLPAGRDGVSLAIGRWDTIALLERWEADEIAVQEHVEGFHDLSHCQFLAHYNDSFPHGIGADSRW